MSKASSSDVGPAQDDRGRPVVGIHQLLKPKPYILCEFMKRACVCLYCVMGAKTAADTMDREQAVGPVTGGYCPAQAKETMVLTK